MEPLNIYIIIAVVTLDMYPSKTNIICGDHVRSSFGGGGGFIHNVLPIGAQGSFFRGVHVGPYRALAKHGSRTYGILYFADLSYWPL